MTFEIALSLFTFASVFIFAHTQIRKNHNSVLKKIEGDKEKIENEMSARLNFIEDKQLQSLKISVNQIESKQLIQQDALEEIKTKITKNSDDSNNEIKSLQRQIQELSQYLEKLQKEASENSSLKSFQNQNEQSDEIEYMPFRKIKGLDEIDDLARAIKQKCKEKSESQALTNVIIKTEDISKIEKSEPNFTDNVVELDTANKNSDTESIDKLSNLLAVDDKLEVESIKEPKTTSVLEVNDHITEAETDFNLEIAASFVQEIEPDCQLMATKPGRTELKISREQRYELINQAVRKLQPIAKNLQPSHRSVESSQSTTSRTRWINPSVLAFSQSGKWEFFVELPKQYIDHEGTVHAIQGKTLLNRQEDDLFGPLYCLDTAIEIILHKSQGRIKNLISLINTRNPVLIFRLTENDNGWKGTLISKPSKGFYLVIAPSSWKRDEETGGQPPIDPESLENSHFTAHYFDTQQGQFITFLKPDGKRHQSKPRKIDLVLEGKTIDDVENRMGPLFYGQPPVISGDYRSWQNIHSIVIGEEGQGQWREQYDIGILKKHLWQIPSLGPKGNSGWFFLRFYDYTGHLVNSLTFRFIRGLKSIQKSVSAFPGYRNERPARIEFDITEEIQVISINDSHKIELEIDKIHDKMIFMCRPSPNIKKLNFEVQEKDGRPVRVAFDVDRIWWRICNEQTNHDFIEWSASLLSKAKSAFSPTTGEILELHLPLSLVRQPIKIGFRREKSLNLQVSIKEQIGKAPLHWFYDEVSEDNIGKKELGVWLINNQESPYYKVLECITHTNCLYCAEIFEERWKLLDHLLDNHDHQLFQNLIIKRDRDLKFLPRKLYVCLLDGMFFSGDPLHRDCFPREMEDHFRDEHPNDRMTFSVISDPDAIQRIKGYKLEQVWKCMNCEDILIPPSDDPFARSVKRLHLLSKHQHYIYQLTS